MASEPCALCGKPVNPHDMGSWKEVSGWVGGPRKDSMRLRRDTGKHAHNHCVQKLQDGQAVDQPTIFESVRINEGDITTERVPDGLFDADDSTIGGDGGLDNLLGR